MDSTPPSHPTPLDAKEIGRRCDAFRGASTPRALGQLLFNLTGLAGVYAGGLAALSAGLPWLLPPLWLLGAVMVMRVFIIQHDAGHGSFLPQRRLNDAVGRLVSVLTFTPYGFWRYAHNCHHATLGDLDKQGIGDVFTCSVAQFEAMTPKDKRRYRRFRNPVYLILIGAPLQFLLRYRTPFLLPVPPRQAWRSVLGLDVALLAVYGAAASVWGLDLLLAVVLPTAILSTWVGGWVFFIQHQFEAGYWRRHADWTFHDAALQGSSYYALPPWLQWCTGNSGIHHIHHLRASIPNYRLQACLDAIPELKEVNRITLMESFRCAHLALWDEDAGRMISFAELDARG